MLEKVGLSTFKETLKNMYTIWNFQSKEIPVELNSLFSKLFCLSPGLLYHLIRREIGRLANEAFTSNPLKQ